jgi:hypothetical protein
MIITLLHRPLAKLRQLDFAFALFWSAYLALWPGMIFWWARL